LSYKIKSLLLAAGLGTRLKPLTDIWPKCLMPIQGRPLLEYWLKILENAGIDDALINTHYFSEYVDKFIAQPQFDFWVKTSHENALLGTAGTIRENINFCKDSTLLLAHADNWTCCNFSDFLDYHINHRPKSTVMTMMTFTCLDTSSCGIVELNCNNIVIGFHEKVKNPPGNTANAAIYILEPEVVSFIEKNPELNDFSIDVIPKFIGKIATWENREIHRDIGTIEMLREAQMDKCESITIDDDSQWQRSFSSNPIHKLVDK